jgi:hypothetical protein
MQKPSLITNSLISGVLTAIVLTLYSYLLLSMNVENKGLHYISYLIMMGGMAYGAIHYRNTSLGGFISFNEAYKSCSVFVLFTSVLTAFLTYVYMRIDGSIIAKLLAKAQEELQNRDLPEEQMEKTLEMMNKMMQPFWMSVISFAAYLFFGFILGLIVSAIVKKDNPDPFGHSAGSALNT